MSESDFPKPPGPSLKDKILSALKKKPVKQKPLVPEGGESQPASKKTKVPVTSENPEDRVIQQQTMESFLTSLTPRERLVYTLIFVEGMTNAEAARKLGVTDEAIRQRRVAIEGKARHQYRK